MPDAVQINRRALIEALNAAQSQNPLPDTKTQLKYPRLYKNGTISRDGIAAVTIAEAMLKEQPLAAFDGGAIAFGGVMHELKIEDLAAWIWNQFHEVKNVDLALNKLEHLISRNSARATTYVLMTDIEVGASVDFSDSWSVSPILDYTKSILVNRLRNLPEGPSSLLSSASAILELRHVETPVLLTSEQKLSDGQKWAEKLQRAQQGRHLELENVKNCLSLVGPCAPAPLVTWTEIAPSDCPSPASPLLLQETEQRIFPIPPLGAFDGDHATTLVRSMLKMGTATRAQLHVPLQRLNRALCQLNPVDRAIDLGIGLEALLLQNIGSTESLRYRFALRGACFHAPKGQSRQNCFYQLRAIYDLRSTAVHTGVVPRTSKTLPQSKAVPIELFLHTSLRLACALLAAVIIRGEIPDWEQVVLNGG